VSRRIDTKVTSRTAALCPPAHTHLEVLKLQQLPGVLHISAFSVDLPTAKHFVPIGEHARRTWKRWTSEEVDCFATFTFPPSLDFALFQSATIEHLEINKHLPIYLERGSVQQLQRLLAGCRVASATLVLDSRTLSSL
ncbi:hypothetical protein PENTCL1PPCAC_15275, partial [Pristionchus entomophagus]